MQSFRAGSKIVLRNTLMWQHVHGMVLVGSGSHTVSTLISTMISGDMVRLEFTLEHMLAGGQACRPGKLPYPSIC